MEKLLQLNFAFNVSPEEYASAVGPLAESFAAVEGLRWKIWIVNPEMHEAGGIYLFESAAACEAFLDGPLAEAVKNHPAVSHLTAKVFDIMAAATAVTRGPVRTGAVR